MNAVNDSPEVNAQDPLPVSQRVFPDLSWAGHSCIITQQVYRPKGVQCFLRQGFYILGLGYIGLYDQRGRPGLFDFLFGF